MGHLTCDLKKNKTNVLFLIFSFQNATAASGSAAFSENIKQTESESCLEPLKTFSDSS